jgi:hypothetical protein
MPVDPSTRFEDATPEQFREFFEGNGFEIGRYEDSRPNSKRIAAFAHSRFLLRVLGDGAILSNKQNRRAVHTADTFGQALDLCKKLMEDAG